MSMYIFIWSSMRSPLAEDIFREADEAAIATANGLANYAQGTISNICIRL